MLPADGPKQNCELLERAKAAYKSANYLLAESTFTTLISRHSSFKPLDSESLDLVILLLDYRAACRYHIHANNSSSIKIDNNVTGVKDNRKKLKQVNWLALAIYDAKYMIQLGPSMCRGYLRLAKLLLDSEHMLTDALSVIEEGILNYSRLDCKLGKLLYEMRDRIKDQTSKTVLTKKDTLLTKDLKSVLFGVTLKVLHLVDMDLTRIPMKRVYFEHLVGLALDRCNTTPEFWKLVNKNLRLLRLKSVNPLPTDFACLNTIIMEDCDDQVQVDALICANLGTLQILRSPFPYTNNKRLLILSAPRSFNAFRLRLSNETNLIINDPLLYALHLDQCTIRSVETPNLMHLTLSSTPSLVSTLHLSLRSLHLINVPITEGFLEAVLRLPKLERLVILGCTMHIHTRHILFTFLSQFLSRNDSFAVEREAMQQKRFLFLIGEFTNTADTVAFRSFYTNNYLKAHMMDRDRDALNTAIHIRTVRLRMEIGRRAEGVAKRLTKWYWQDLFV